MRRSMVVLVIALSSLVGTVHAQFKNAPVALSSSEMKPSSPLESALSPRRAPSVQLLSLGINERPSLSDRVNPGVLGHDMHLTTNACAADFATCHIAGTFHFPAQSIVRGDPAEVVFSAGSHGRLGLHYVIKLQ